MCFVIINQKELVHLLSGCDFGALLPDAFLCDWPLHLEKTPSYVALVAPEQFMYVFLLQAS